MTRIASGLLPFAALAAAALLAAPAAAATFSAYYGDDDGFGVGAFTGTMNPTVSNAGPGEAPFTDVRLIGTGFAAPAFQPTGTFGGYALDGAIVAATLTMRAGSFDSVSPVDGANILRLDGLDVDPAFFSLFATNTESNDNFIEERTFALDAAFFPLLADGLVSLAGTRISEGGGSGSFQIDFLRLDITTDSAGAIPEPATWALLICGFALVGAALRRRRRRPAGIAAIA